MNMDLRTLAALCTIAAVLSTGCADSAGNPTGSGTGSSTSEKEDQVPPLITGTDSSETAASVINPVTAGDNEDISAEEADCSISFSGGAADISGDGAACEGTTVTISKAGTYAVSGICADGRIIIDASGKDEVTLVLDGVELTSSDGPAILCEKAKKLVIALPEGSASIISDSASYTLENGADEPDAAIFSRKNMVIKGSGALTVNGNYSSAVKCKDGLKICGGNITANSAGDGIKGRDYIVIGGGTVMVNSGSDGLKSTNDVDAKLGYISITGGNITINSDGDGIQAQTALMIDGGTIDITAGGGCEGVEYQSSDRGFSWGGHGGFFANGQEPFDFGNMTDEDGGTAQSMKGLKADGSITVSGGVITIDSADDSIHSDGNVLISGGELTISTGDDGIHAGGNLTVEDGEILIKQSYEGLEGMSIDISGGIIGLTAYDDGLNAAGGDNAGFFGYGSSDEYYINISGGDITVNASGDGVDSNGTIAMSGGSLTVFGPTDSANGAIDYDNSFAMSGGTLIALGASGMAQAPSTLSQPCLSIYADVSAGSAVEVRDSGGAAVLSVVTPKACQSLIFSTDRFKSGEEYSIYADDTLLTTVTAGDGVTGGGASGSGFGGFGGFGGMGGRGDRDNRGNRGGNARGDDTDPGARGEAPPDMPSDGFDDTPPDGFGGGNRREGAR